MRIPIALSLILLVTTTARADDRAESAAVRAELDREVAAWNAADLDGYLRGYEHSPTTLMIGHDLLRGWDAIAAHYRQAYSSPARMGKLSFADLEIRLLGADYALAVGRWQLTRATADGGPASGWFTLDLRKTKDGWRIVLDHTS